jgi:PAS domain S-box-containing protein
VAEYIAAARYNPIYLVAAFAGLIWYVAYYTKVRPRIFLSFLTALFIVPAIVAILNPGMVYGDISGLTTITLSWGEQLADLDAAGSLWLDIFSVAQLGALGFIIFACFRQFFRGERKNAAILGLGMLWFIIALSYELLSETGLVPYFPLAETGFIGIAIAVSLQMTNAVIKTEEGLANYSSDLAVQVATRTADLDQRNAQLENEIAERERTAAALGQSELRFRKVFEEGPFGMALVAPDFTFSRVNQAFCRLLGYTADELRALTFPEITHPADVEKDVALARQLFAGEIPFYQIEKRYLTKSGDAVWINLTAALFRDEAQQPTFGLAMIEDITGQRQAKQALNRRVEELSVLHDIAQILATNPDLTTALQEVCQAVTSLFEGRYTHVIIPVSDQTESAELVGFDRETGFIPVTSIDLALQELPFVATVLAQKQSQIVTLSQDQPLPGVVLDYVNRHRLQVVLLAPLTLGGQAVGFMAVAADQPGRRFSGDEIRLAETIAGDIVAAVENARLLEQQKLAAAARERSHIARELHDSVTQTLYSVSIVAEALPRVLARDLDEAKRNVGYLRRTTLGALAEMRTLLFELRPETLLKAGLSTLLQQLADVLTGRSRIPVEVTVDGKPDISPEAKVALYRIAQEAFNNIAKHSRASQVWVTLHANPEQVILAIRDNGRGFDPQSAPQDRLGLRIMRERASEIRATLTVDSQPDQGTRIAVTWVNSNNHNDGNE